MLPLAPVRCGVRLLGNVICPFQPIPAALGMMLTTPVHRLISCFLEGTEVLLEVLSLLVEPSYRHKLPN